MLEINHTWTSTGSSGGLTAVYVNGWATDSVLMVQHSTLATTNSVSFQIAQESTGPWLAESSAAISTTATPALALRVTGPYNWMRPYLHTASSGTYQLRLIGNS